MSFAGSAGFSFLGLIPVGLWYFIPPAAADKRTIENPFLTREDFLVRCLPPQVPPSSPFSASAALGLAVSCPSMPFTHAFSLLSIFSFMSHGLVDSMDSMALSLPPPLLCPTDRCLRWRRLESCQLPRRWVWWIALSPISRVSSPGGGAQPPLIAGLRGLGARACWWYCVGAHLPLPP